MDVVGFVGRVFTSAAVRFDQRQLFGMQHVESLVDRVPLAPHVLLQQTLRQRLVAQYLQKNEAQSSALNRITETELCN